MVPWAHPSPQPKWHLDRFSHFCRAHNRDRQTNQPSDHATPSVTIGHTYVHSTAMWPNKNWRMYDKPIQSMYSTHGDTASANASAAYRHTATFSLQF